jgi:hypothetical protein
VIAIYSSQEGSASYMRVGERRLTTCPTEPIDLRLDSGWDTYELEFDVNGDSISWSPALPLQWLAVFDANHEYKWAIGVDDEASGMDPPVSYGVLPPGTSRYYPGAGDEVLPLESGDFVGGWGYGVTTAGYQYYATGEVEVP